MASHRVEDVMIVAHSDADLEESPLAPMYKAVLAVAVAAILVAAFWITELNILGVNTLSRGNIKDGV